MNLPVKGAKGEGSVHRRPKLFETGHPAGLFVSIHRMPGQSAGKVLERLNDEPQRVKPL
jgi:hypothetical protein